MTESSRVGRVARRAPGSARRSSLGCAAGLLAGIAAGLGVGRVEAQEATVTSTGAIAPDVVITDVTLIDGTGAPPKPAQAIAIAGDRIAWIGLAADAARDGLVERAGEVIVASGEFAVPGLIDMHVHPDDPEIWELFDPDPAERDRLMTSFIRWGVTTVRDMGGSLDVIRDWKRRIAAGELVGPRIVAAGPLVDGPEPMWMGSVSISTPAEAGAAVDSLAGEGIDFLKIYGGVPRDAFFAAVERAHQRGLRVAGHVPDAVSLEEALEAGMDIQEHLWKTQQAFSDRPAIGEAVAALGPEASRSSQGLAAARAAADTYDPEMARDYFRRLAAAGIAVDPTLIVWRRNAFYDPDDPVVMPLLADMPAYLREWWTPGANVHLRNRTPESTEMLRVYYRLWKRIAGDAHAAGVTILAGSDTGGNPHLVPGFSLHEELAELVEAGLAPAEALAAATVNAARAMELGDEVGTLEVGKRADLVLLGADPLADIRNTRTVRLVVARGRVQEASPHARD